jgi:hypothetical protein
MDSCSNCIHYCYESLLEAKGCQIWSDFNLNIKRLPIELRCPGCSGHQPVTPNEFNQEVHKTGPKSFVINKVKIGNYWNFGGIIVAQNDKCAFYKRK